MALNSESTKPTVASARLDTFFNHESFTISMALRVGITGKSQYLLNDWRNTEKQFILYIKGDNSLAFDLRNKNKQSICLLNGGNVNSAHFKGRWQKIIVTVNNVLKTASMFLNGNLAVSYTHLTLPTKA